MLFFFYIMLKRINRKKYSLLCISTLQTFVVFQLFSQLSHVWPFVTPCAAAYQASLSITNPQSLLKLMSIKSVMPSNHLILCRPLLLLPSIFPSIRVFSNESTLCIRWLKYWSFRFSISPSNKYSGLISLRIVWFDLLAVEGTLKSLLQHHSSEASILGHSAFFMVQLSHPYVTTAKTKNQRWFNIKVGELRKWPYFFSFPILANLIFFKKYVDRFLSTPSSYWFLSSRMRTPRSLEQPLVSTPSPVTRAFPPTLPQMAVQVQMEPEPSGPWRTTVQWV